MTEIEKMQRYIEQGNVDRYGEYDLIWNEVVELCELIRQDGASALEVIDLAFNYGKTKGYLAAKAEVRA